MMTPIATPTTLVLLDPTSDGGESALDLLDEQDRHVTLVVLISGTASQALRDFADAEQVYVSDAGWRYLEQVADRLHLQPEQLAFVNASGPDAASELALVAATEEIHRVLLPSSVDRFERGLSDSIARSVAAPVITAPLSARLG